MLWGLTRIVSSLPIADLDPLDNIEHVLDV